MVAKLSANRNEQSAKQQIDRTWLFVLLAVGAFFLFLIQRCTTSRTPPLDARNQYTFQPEPRQPSTEPRPPSINLGLSSGALPNAATIAPLPTPQVASCASLQQFANFEYARRFRDGKLAELLSFSGFENQQVSISGEGLLTCRGGSYIRRGANVERRCNNVVISYDTKSNTLSHNVQYRFLERGLVAECSEVSSSASR
jgi:hypothetical protein